MGNSRIGSECQVTFANETGAGAKLLGALAGAGVNLLGVVGYELGAEQAAMHVLAEDADKACATIRASGYACESVEVVLVDVDDRSGAAAGVLGKLAAAGVSVEHCYATAGSGGKALLVLRTKDNARAMTALN
jgi:hypothetical protein